LSFRSCFLQQVNFRLTLNYEEDFDIGGGAAAEVRPSGVHGVGGDGEDDFATGRADEIKIAIAADEAGWRSGRHARIFSGSGSIHGSRGRIKSKVKAGDEKFDVYQIGTEATERESDGVEGEFAAEGASAEAKRGEEGGAGTEEGVEDEVAFGGGGEEDAFEESDGLLRGMLAEFFLPGFGRRDGPDGLHLLAAGELLHEGVVEFVAGLFIFGGPDDGFGGVGEVAAGKIGRRIGLDPGDVVEELEFELLHGEADGMDDVGGAADPDGAVGLEDALAGGEPIAIKLVIGIGAAGDVPGAFVDADHFAGVAGDAVVGEEVGRVGEYQVEGVGRKGGEDIEAIALEDFEEMLFVFKDRGGKAYCDLRG